MFFRMLKRIVPVLLFALVIPAVSGADRLKVGLYSDYGAHGSGVWLRLLGFSPQMELVLLDAADIRGGKLASVDLLVMPGGLTGEQFHALGKEGMEAIRKYVAEGGKYLGTCAGCGLAMNIRIGLGIVNCKNFRNTDRGRTTMPVRINEEGGRILGIKPGIYHIRYANGPIPVLAPESPDWDGKATVCATYEGTIGRPKHRTMGDIYGRPAIVFATYGKGRVIASGVHPETFVSTWPIALGAIRALTGVECTVEPVILERRPIRVAYYTFIGSDKVVFQALLDLCSSPKFDVVSAGNFDSTGSLDHVDALVLPDGRARDYVRRFSRDDWRRIREFQDRGGMVFGFGEGAKHLPKHRNSRELKDWKELKPEMISSFQ